MNDPLQQTLQEALPDLQRLCVDPWVLIGSAAARLVGADVGVADIDVLTSVADADRLVEHWQARRESLFEPAGAERFRSRFARFRFTGLPLEVMGGLQLHDTREWVPVIAGETMLVAFGGMQIPVPRVVEQIRILESFGRPKDLQRAALLRALS
ncbi:hypothetical protein [Dyella sp. GSA-30]|uniref:hypothetical protein n=1 Tax=Dyella sp. GSA-30 TaxID=2994496 RepID=UPI0024900BB3|nr:hypothetical protein [Dyella sp. GSA-30]BDU21108.1 hypothetical protein DYGSA30_25650 [Dyella sp. GSA-30]